MQAVHLKNSFSEKGKNKANQNLQKNPSFYNKVSFKKPHLLYELRLI